MKLPETTFFIELPEENFPKGYPFGKALLDLLHAKTSSGNKTIEMLRDNGFGVSIAVRDLSVEFRQAVVLLNTYNIPVSFWVVLPDEDGYWSSVLNVHKTIARAREIIAWIKGNRLLVQNLGFDNEWPLEIAKAISSGKILRFLTMFISFIVGRLLFTKESNVVFKSFLKELRDKDISVEHYMFPGVLKTFTTGGLTKLKTDRKIEMLYTSMVAKPFRNFFLKSSWKKDRIPSFGIISGKSDETPGRDLTDGNLHYHLSDEELARAINFGLENDAKEIYIFALNSPEVIEQVQRSYNLALSEQSKEYWL